MRCLVCLTAASFACAPNDATSRSRSGDARAAVLELTPEWRAAIGDSVRAMLFDYADTQNRLPIDPEWIPEHFEPDYVVGSDVSGSLTMFGYDAFAASVARGHPLKPLWMRTFQFQWDSLYVAALAPGAASYVGRYTEHFTDTTGVEWVTGGIMGASAIHTANGWRLRTGVAAHDTASERVWVELEKRHAPRP